METPTLCEPASRAWHELTPAEAMAALGAQAPGLAEAEAAARLARHGPNRLPDPPRKGALRRFLQQFHNVLIYVLLASAAVTAGLGHVVDTAVILAVVVVNAVIGFVQEGRAEQAMEAIRGMLAPSAAVLRDGARRTVPAEQLVPGDMVLLEAGDKVPADVRLVAARGLRIQEAILTGESVAVEKRVEPVVGAAALGDRTCMAFSGTLVAAGQGVGVVAETGPRAEIGRISGMLSEVPTLTTPLVRQMSVFAKWLTVLILLVAGLLLAFGYFIRHQPFGELFMMMVGLSVAAIPEGLPAVLTITLAIGVQAMARRNAIVRKLPAIETIGSVGVICTDKTGTLTRNEMMVASVVLPGARFTVEGEGYEPEGRIAAEAVAAGDEARLAALGEACALCNDAALRHHEGAWVVEGDPMEGALLAFARKAGFDGESRRWHRTDAIPFDAAHRFMATLHHDHEGRAAIHVKGAPERVLAMCREERGAGGSIALRAQHWHREAERIAARGERVLAIAARAADPSHAMLEFADVEGTLTLLGLVGLIDPPRPEAVAAVAECHAAGIRVKMITGDHAATAAAIGRSIGLRNPGAVLTGAQLDAMDEGALAHAVLEADVFARTSPEHKLRLVMALQSHGLAVAMTGDGVNDAPALKRADAGIAMGRKGSEAAKEAADLVLADDNFASIVAAVREGRTVYDNLRKVIGWTLPTNAGEAIVIAAALLAGMAMPVTPVQVLWINLVTAVTLGVALAFEPTEERTMRRPPRGRDEPLVDGALAWQVVLMAILVASGVFAVFTYATSRGYPIELARTLAVNTLVVMEIFYLFFVRNIHGTSLTWKAARGTRVVWITVLAVTAAQFAMTYAPPMQRLFGTAPVAFLDGLLVVAMGVALFAVIEVEKQVRLRLRALRAAEPAP